MVANPKAQSKAGRRGRAKVVSGLLAAGGAAGIAAAAAATGPVIAGAAIAAGITGLIVGDRNMVFPVDMIAIPAYQGYMITGVPTFQVYIKAGETLMATGGNVDDVTLGMVEAEALASGAPKKRKLSAYNRFTKRFKFRAKRKNESQSAYFSARSKAVSRAWKKEKRGGK